MSQVRVKGSTPQKLSITDRLLASYNQKNGLKTSKKLTSPQTENKAKQMSRPVSTKVIQIADT